MEELSVKIAGLPEFLWSELCLTACHVRNRLPLDRLGFKSPFEVWSGRKPSIDHLRIIGSDAYALIPKQFRKKFDSKFERLVLVRYEPDCKSYRLLKRGSSIIKIVESPLSSGSDATSSQHSSNLNGHDGSDGSNRPVNVVDFGSFDNLPIVQQLEREAEVPSRQDSLEQSDRESIDSLPPDLIEIDPGRVRSVVDRPDDGQLVEIQSSDTRPIACRTRRQISLNLTRLVPCLTTTQFMLPSTYEEAINYDQKKF